MKYAYVHTLLLMSVFHTSCGQSQTNVPKENINLIAIKSEIKDSITTNVWDIKQDRNGNIWFAADDGVYRYDARLSRQSSGDSVGQGKSFTNITGKLIPVPIFSILEDRKGNFWFGTYGSGAYYYDGKTFQNFTTRDGLANNSVMPIYEDKDGIIWFGTAGGVSRYDGKSFRNFTTKDGLTNNDVHAIVQDKTGKIWFGTRGDITIYDGKTFTVLKNKDGKTFTNVWAIIKDKEDNIWFGADGLWRYDGTAFTQIDEMGAGVIIKDKKGNVLTSIGGPIFRYDEQSLSDKKPHVTVIKTGYEGRRNLPFGMLGADDGSIWIGSYRYNYDARPNGSSGRGKTLTRSK
ncbi:MAG TPA: two-component regulator propeller domain-containing protein [Saprospiraceae bacterium]|nr:two-component regulator propeller domain-containing protein [Saprospiraceae bacterium]